MLIAGLILTAAWFIGVCILVINDSDFNAQAFFFTFGSPVVALVLAIIGLQDRSYLKVGGLIGGTIVLGILGAVSGKIVDRAFRRKVMLANEFERTTSEVANLLSIAVIIAFFAIYFAGR
jgi:hypothetical protein